MTRDALGKVEREREREGEAASIAQHTQIDRALRRIAVAQAALDADEAHWLRIAELQRIWPKLGYVHAFEYLEEVFGYAPRTAAERLRVARELGELPQLEDALRCGELSWSVARELTRVATPETIDAWIDDARGRRLRDVEQMVSGRKKGDKPGDPADPARVRQRVVLELDGESLAIWRQMQQVVELECEQKKLDDRAFVLALGSRVLDGDVIAANENDTRTNTARHMIHVTTCRDCRRGWQDGAGVRVELDRSAIDRAECNAILCDDEDGKRPTRTVPARIERLVLERAQHRCEVPGCRSSKYLAIHHIVFRSAGGMHEPSNLVVLCDGHHRVLHDGQLQITGKAPDALVFGRGGASLVGREGHAPRKHVARGAVRAPALGEDDPIALAQAALRQLGFKAADATRAVEVACAHVGTEVELGVLIKEALRQCGKQ